MKLKGKPFPAKDKDIEFKKFAERVHHFFVENNWTWSIPSSFKKNRIPTVEELEGLLNSLYEFIQVRKQNHEYAWDWGASSGRLRVQELPSGDIVLYLVEHY
jgi:hypothetical protein